MLASPWMTKIEACEYLRVSSVTLDRYVRDGRVTRYYLEGLQTPRFSRVEVMNLVKQSVLTK